MYRCRESFELIESLAPANILFTTQGFAMGFVIAERCSSQSKLADALPKKVLIHGLTEQEQKTKIPLGEFWNKTIQ